MDEQVNDFLRKGSAALRAENGTLQVGMRRSPIKVPTVEKV